MILSLAALLGLAIDEVTDGAVYYCDAVNGNDANNGLSEEEAFKTIHKGVWTVPDGQGPLYLMTGNYPYEEWYPGTGYPTRTQYLVVTKLPGHTPVIEQLSVYYGMHWWLDFYQLTFDLPNTGNPPGASHVLWLRRGAYLKVRECIVKGVLQAAPGDPRYRADYCNLDGIKILEASLDMSGCHDILVQDNTISECGHCAVHLHTDNIGNNIDILDNEISQCACNGNTITCDVTVWPNGSNDDPPLIQGNYIHEQTVMWAADYSIKAHGSGIYINSPKVTINANVIDSFGNTAAMCTYATPVGIEFKDLIITNNLIIHPPNPGFELRNLSSGVQINHNTIIGCDTGVSGINKFETGATNSLLGFMYYETKLFEYSDLEFCNNIYLMRCDISVLLASGHVTGNIFWSIGTGTTQTAVDASHPGNIVLCDSVDDSNSVDFETGGDYFAGGVWFNANAFEPAVEGDFYWSAGEAGTPGHAFDLVAGASAVNFGSNTYTALYDFWNTERTDGHPDSGYHEIGGGSPPNTAPVLDAIGAKAVRELSVLTFDVNATDVDSDPCTYSADDLPTGAAFVSPTFRWVPTDDQAGTYVVYFEVSDGTDTDFEYVTITVNPKRKWFIGRK